MRAPSNPPSGSDATALAGRGAIVWVGMAVAFAAGLLWWWQSQGTSQPSVALRQKAQLFMQTHQLDQARPIIERLNAGPGRADEDRLLLGVLRKEEGRLNEAEEALAPISDDSDQAALTYLARGQVERERYRMAHAERYFRRALEIDPDLLAARYELIYLYGMELRRPELHQQFREVSKRRALPFRDVFLWCLTRRVDWDPEGSYKELSRYVEADPDDRQARLALADCLRLLTRFDEGLETLDRLPKDDHEARVLRARIYLDQGALPGAEALLAEGPERDPGMARFQGRLALARRDWQSAIEQFRIGLEADPGDRDALFGLGQALNHLGRTEEARPYLKAAADYDLVASLMTKAAADSAKDDPELIRALGAAFAAVGRRDEARAWYRLLIDRNPLDADAQEALFRLREDEPLPPGR
ncbi:MAG: tetratricopeptide repeat protein [Isosphaeraceae bacterium]